MATKMQEGSDTDLTTAAPNLGKLQWERKADITYSVFMRTQAVSINGQVYVGGGGFENPLPTVSQFDPDTNAWLDLPKPGEEYLVWFALCAYQDTLVTVGGAGGKGCVGTVYQYQDKERKWVEYITPMPTARGILCALTTKSAIIACGGAENLVVLEGKVKDAKFTDAVEVYSFDAKQWYKADPLPVPCMLMSSTAFNDNGYLFGGWEWLSPSRKAFYANLPSLVSKAMAIAADSKSESAWKSLPDVLLNGATAANLSGALISVGGSDLDVAYPTLYFYNPTVNAWNKLYEGDLPTPIYNGTVANISDKILFVCGGENTYYTYIGTST